MRTKNIGRIVICFLLLLGLMVIYGVRLYSLQIVNGESYATRNDQTYDVTVTIEASRGEILDRYGRPLAVNRQGFALCFDKAYLPDDTQNEIILTTLQLLEKLGEEWTDLLPISREKPFTFLEGQELTVESLKTKFRLNDWATAEDLMSVMAENYEVEGFTPEETRMILSVRYAMDLYGFNVSNTYTVAEDISSETVVFFEENSFRLPGVVSQEVAIRDYPNGTVAPHLIGTVTPIYADEYETLAEEGYAMDDKIGRTGLEAACEDLLRGTDGEKVITFDMEGNVVEEVVTREPEPGATVYCTIDSALQSFALTALETRIEEIVAAADEEGDPGYDCHAGAIVIEDVNTGDLLAAVTYPSYDLSTYYEDYSELCADEDTPLWNRAMYGTYAPGSTFKPCVTVAAMAEGVVTASTHIQCSGIYTYYDDYQPTCMDVHGSTDYRKALQYSCNCYYYEVGRLLGIEAIDKYANLMGMGVKTGVETGEALGQIASPELRADMNETWNPGDTIQSAIGQSDTEVTPLQLCAYCSTLATKGIRYRTRLVRSVTSYDGSEELVSSDPEVVVDLSEYAEYFDLARDGMEASAQEGTVQYWFANFQCRVATKTGTPQVGISDKSNNATFIAFAPADDPQIAVSVVLEQGGHGYYIAPLMVDLLNYYFDNQTDSVESVGGLLK